MENIKINFSLEALRAKRAELARIQHREYETRGNTQRAQELWEQITKLDEEIERRESSMEKRIKGTIKAHTEYNEIKQTELTRCKITKEETK